MNEKLLINKLKRLDVMITALLEQFKELERSDKSTKELSDFTIKHSKLFLKKYYSKDGLKNSEKGFD